MREYENQNNTIRAALAHALQRLNAVSSGYNNTDFRLIDNALALAEGRSEPWPNHKSKAKEAQ
jgi:hypothetical protein